VPVNVKWWNEYFAKQARSISLSDDEAARVLLRSPIGAACTRFENLLVEIAKTDPVRHTEIRQLVEIKMKEVEELQK
jgi:hypothetical protein